MTPLRRRMIEDMRMRNFSEHTIAAYVSAVYRLANHYHRSPDQLDREEIRAFLVDLVDHKRASWPYYKQVLAGLRYFYRHVLRRGEVVEDIRGPRPEKRLPVVLSVEEVARFFKVIPSLKHRTILMLAYGAGLRICEAVRIRLSDIDRRRKVIRVSQGKGKKDRYTLLSAALLEMLRVWAEIRLSIPALFGPSMQTRWTVLSVIGRSLNCVVNNRSSGWAAQQYRLRVIQVLLGHASPKTTAICTHVSTALIGKTVIPFDKLPDVESRGSGDGRVGRVFDGLELGTL